MLSDDRPDQSAVTGDTGADTPEAAEGGRGDERPDAEGPRPDENLLSRLDIVESQPLSDRAAAYEAIHEDLARRLEQSPDAPRS